MPSNERFGLDPKKSTTDTILQRSWKKPWNMPWFATAFVPCDCGRPCCSGRRSNEEWTHAIGILSQHIKEVVLFGCNTTFDMRVDYLKRFFLHKNTRLGMDALAKKHAVVKNTICRHFTKVKRFLLGGVANGIRQAGLEERAMTAISDRLEQSGIIGERE